MRLKILVLGKSEESQFIQRPVGINLKQGKVNGL